MHPNQNSSSVHFRFSNEISYLKIIRVILSRWHWLTTALIIGLIAGYAYLWYVPPLYSTRTSLKFEEKKSEISELINVRNLYDRNNKAQSEKFVIRSRNVLLKAIASLHYDISYYTSTGFLITDIYPKQPINLSIIEWNKTTDSYPDFEFREINANGYQLSYFIGNKTVSKSFSYGQIISLPHLKFKILPKEITQKNKTYIFKFNNQTEMLERISKALKIDEDQNVNVLNLKITDHNSHFAADILNAIVSEYLNFDKLQRSISISQTANFISSLLQTMSEAVKNSGKAIQEFKEVNQIINISSSSSLTSNHLANLETEKHTLDIQSVLINFIEKDLIATNFDKLNYNLQGISDPQLNKLLEKYNDLLIRKKEALTIYTQNSRIVSQLDEQIKDFKTALINNISSQRKSNIKTLTFLTKQIDSIRQNLINIPKAERNYINLQSKFDIDQKVYSYLAEKKLEAQISKAAVIPGAIVIDKATYSNKPDSPVKAYIYTIFMLSSLFLAISLIFIIRILNPYIYNKETIELLSKVPIIGIIGKHQKKETNPGHKIITLSDPRSLFTESIRSIRSNLSFFAPEQFNKIICIISEVSGEGKSLISINLAAALTLIEKRVLLIAADLRKSKLHLKLDISNQDGLSRYLSGQTSLNNILNKTKIKNLDFVSSGPVSPNPSELLHGQKMLDLLNIVKKEYDFVIIDSAPIGLVTDGKPLIKMADINLFIIRSGVSKHVFAATPDKLKKELELSNIAIILNDFEEDHFYSNYYTSKHADHNNYYYSDHTNYNYHKDYFDL